MEGSAAYTFAVVCEAAADLRLAADLADRVLCQEVDWIDREDLDLHRRWRGFEREDSHLEWHWVRRVAKEHHLRGPHGHFKEKPGALDAAMARKALLLLSDAQNPPDAVVLVRDTDGWEERRRGLTQARDVKPWPFEVAGNQAREEACWTTSDLETLKERGRRSGLADYLEEVRERLVPLFTTRR